MAEMTGPEIKQKIADVTSMIDSAKKALNKGETVDLRHLETKAAELYEIVARHPATTADMGSTVLIDSFAAILRGLDQLEAALKAQQARMTATAMSSGGGENK